MVRPFSIVPTISARAAAGTVASCPSAADWFGLPPKTKPLSRVFQTGAEMERSGLRKIDAMRIPWSHGALFDKEVAVPTSWGCSFSTSPATVCATRPLDARLRT